MAPSSPGFIEPGSNVPRAGLQLLAGTALECLHVLEHRPPRRGIVPGKARQTVCPLAVRVSVSDYLSR